MPRKIASTKKDRPSKANGRPSTSPNVPISPGQSRPISKLRTVPETAPIANSTAETLAHRFGELERDRVVAHDAAPVHHEDHRRERDAEAGEHDVPAERERHLLPGGKQPLGLRRRDELDGVREEGRHHHAFDATPAQARITGL